MGLREREEKRIWKWGWEELVYGISSVIEVRRILRSFFLIRYEILLYFLKWWSN